VLESRAHWLKKVAVWGRFNDIVIGVMGVQSVVGVEGSGELMGQ
jgi:hypothetical protein